LRRYPDPRRLVSALESVKSTAVQSIFTLFLFFRTEFSCRRNS
jgi:hypothetical protein